MTNLDQFLDDLSDSLPEICVDKDLVTRLPDIFRNPPNLNRMRSRKQAPKHFTFIPTITISRQMSFLG